MKAKLYKILQNNITGFLEHFVHYKKIQILNISQLCLLQEEFR